MEGQKKSDILHHP